MLLEISNYKIESLPGSKSVIRYASDGRVFLEETSNYTDKTLGIKHLLTLNLLTKTYHCPSECSLAASMQINKFWEYFGHKEDYIDGNIPTYPEITDDLDSLINAIVSGNFCNNNYFYESCYDFEHIMLNYLSAVVEHNNTLLKDRQNNLVKHLLKMGFVQKDNSRYESNEGCLEIQCLKNQTRVATCDPASINFYSLPFSFDEERLAQRIKILCSNVEQIQSACHDYIARRQRNTDMLMRIAKTIVPKIQVQGFSNGLTFWIPNAKALCGCYVSLNSKTADIVEHIKEIKERMALNESIC